MTPRVDAVKVRVMGEDDAVLRFVESLALLPPLAQDRIQLGAVSDPYPCRSGGGVRRYVDVYLVDEPPTTRATVPVDEYAPGYQPCGDCMCCTENQCGTLTDNECPTNSLGESTCPCTCN